MLAELWGWGPPDWRDLTWTEVARFSDQALAFLKARNKPRGVPDGQ